MWFGKILHVSGMSKYSGWPEEKQVHVGMEASKTNQTRWEWHHNIFTPSLHLVPFCRHLHKYGSCLFVQKGCERHATTHMTVFHNHAWGHAKSFSYFWSYKSLKNDHAGYQFYFILFIYLFFRKSKLKENGVAICSGVDSGGCVVRFDVHGEWVMLWVAAM